MRNRRTRMWLSATGTGARLALPTAALAAVMVWFPQTGNAQASQPPPPGAPLPGLTQGELQRFGAGRNDFLHNERPEEGLGPVFNGVACAQCHRAAAPGGASADTGISRVTRIGAIVNGAYTDLAEFGGALIQARSLREFDPNYPVPREIVPVQASIVARRITTPLFGLGLMEAIPSATIQQAEDPFDLNGDGVSGRANLVMNPETGNIEVGRFGWKAQVSSVHVFSADAYLNEMGITNPLFPVEVRPQGQNIPPGADRVPDPEDDGSGVARLTDFQRFLAAPPVQPRNSVEGRNLFRTTGCASCHRETMQTGFNPVAALSNKAVNLYSDLLLHDMGPGLGDGIQQGTASGNEFRTAPLWGLRFRPFLLHDGRAGNPDQAIRMHGGEALRSVTNYINLTQPQRDAILGFLRNL